MSLPETISEAPGPSPGLEETQDHEVLAPRLAQRFRVVLATGSFTQTSAELQTLLARRLRVVSLIPAGTFTAMFVLHLSRRWGDLLAGQADWYAAIILPAQGVCIALSAAVAGLLWSRFTWSLRQLRGFELVLVAMLIAFDLLQLGVHWYTWDFHSAQFADHPAGLRVRLSWLENYYALHWAVGIVSYGVFIPNTARRCAAVVAVIALSPFVLSIAFCWLRPLPTEVVGQFLVYLSIWMGAAIAIAVFGASRIEVLRQRAAEAWQLGQYVLKRRLGVGGMGEVYLAEHVLLRRPCALKLIRPERVGDPKNLARFEREVHATATLTHPNTVQVFDYGHTEEDTFYYVMEYLPGLTLEQLVRQHGPLPPARAVHFLRQVCGALREAHSIGLIHRDIKPSNVMICERGGEPDVAKLLDFGLVLPQGDSPDPDQASQVGTIIGTPAYMSPEQASGGESVDARSDIYSAGALAYFLLTGQPPFAGRSSVQVLAAHLYEPPAPLSQHRADVPDDLQAVVLRCLAKDPSQRFPDAHSLDSALGSCRTGGWSGEDGAAWWRATGKILNHRAAWGSPR